MTKKLFNRVLVISLCLISFLVFYKPMSEVKAEECNVNQGENLQEIKAMWFWCNYNLEYERDYVVDKELREETLDKLQQDGINMLFLTMDTDKLYVYKDFLKDAHERGMKVQALFGDPAMIYDDFSQWTRKVIDDISDYNNENEEVYKIDGIHYDVEFYCDRNREKPEEKWIDGESEEARKSVVRKEYINFVREVCSYAYNKNIETAFDVPAWLDRFTFYDNDGLNKNIADEVCRAADYIVIMDYTTNAKNIFNSLNNTSVYNFSDGSRAKSYMNWMERTAKFNNKLIIGVDLETFKNEAQAKANNPSLVPYYIAEDYEYSKDYVMKIINDSMCMIEEDLEKEDLSLNYGYGIHNVYPWLKLNKN